MAVLIAALMQEGSTLLPAAGLAGGIWCYFWSTRRRRPSRRRKLKD
jgi:hypothetical protein